MKKANPDLYQVATTQYLQKLSYLRKFIKYWGTTTVNGREVLVNTNYHYPTWTRRDTFERWAKLLGIWGSFKDPKMEGVENAWVFLNEEKADTAAFTDSLIASNLDAVMGAVEGDLEVSVMIGPKVVGGTLGKKLTLSKLNISTPLTDQEGIMAELLQEIDYLWDNCVISSGTPSDVYKDILARYLLKSSDVPYEMIEVTSAMVEAKVPVTEVTYEDGEGFSRTTTYVPRYYQGYKVRLKVPQFNFSETTDMVLAINADVQNTNSIFGSGSPLNRIVTQQAVNLLQSRAQDSTVGLANSLYTTSSVPVDPLVWETSVDGSRYLRVDFLLNKEIPLQERIEFLNSLIDSDYREESNDGGLFGFLLTIAVFAVAVLLTPVTGGASLYVALSAGTATTLMVASAITFGALVLAVTTVALYAAGAVELANSFAKFSKAIEPLVMIATIVTLVNIVNTVKKLAEEGSKATASALVTEQLKDAGVDIAKELADEMGKALFDGMVDEVALELVTDQFNSMVWVGVKDRFANLLSSKITDITFEQGIKVANYVFEQVQKNETAQIKDQIADERSKLEALQKEEVQVNDLLVDINRGLYAPLAKDQSMYAATYAKPYEWWSTRYHTGCCQYNGVSAMWLADKAK
jgi:hypothetical protein